MIKTKRIKRNWGEGDLTILTWIVSKFTERKNYTDLERDIVSNPRPRRMRTGSTSPPSYQESQPRPACSSGSA